MRNRYDVFKFDDDNFIILKTKSCYRSIGRRWSTEPYKVTNTVISPEFYTNFITSIPWFNNFGYRAYCRGYWRYTVAGYLPTKVITGAPDGSEKNTAEFKFIPRRDLLKNAGWREKTVIENAKKFSIERIDGADMITFYTDLDGVTSSATYDALRKIWRA